MECSVRRLFAAAVTMLLLALATSTKAVPITYQITGTASGTIGGTPFTNVLVTVALSSDTSSVIASPYPDLNAANVVANPGTTTVNIPGVGSATVSDTTAAFSSVTPLTIPGFPVLPYVLIAVLDHPPSLQQITAIGVTGDNAFLGYDLRTPIGPVTGLGSVGHPTDIIHTSRGNLTFTADITPTPQGSSFAATSQITPQVGLWWNPDESGSGYALDYKHGVLVVTLYSYVSNGDPIWYLAAGPVSGSNFFSATLDKYRAGQCISCPYPGRPTAVGNDGTVTIQFTSPTSATMTLPGGRVVPIQPQPF